MVTAELNKLFDKEVHRSFSPKFSDFDNRINVNTPAILKNARQIKMIDSTNFNLVPIVGFQAFIDTRHQC